MKAIKRRQPPSAMPALMKAIKRRRPPPMPARTPTVDTETEIPTRPMHIVCSRASMRGTRPDRNLTARLRDPEDDADSRFGFNGHGYPRLQHRYERWLLELARSQKQLEGDPLAEEEVAPLQPATIEFYCNEESLNTWLVASEPPLLSPPAPWQPPLEVVHDNWLRLWITRRVPATVESVTRNNENGDLLEVVLRDETADVLHTFKRASAAVSWTGLGVKESETSLEFVRPVFGRRMMHPPPVEK